MAIALLARAFEASARWERDGTSDAEALDETIGREHSACYLLADMEELHARIADLIAEGKIDNKSAAKIVATVDRWEAECKARRRKAEGRSR